MGHSKDETKNWGASVEQRRFGGFLRLDFKVRRLGVSLIEVLKLHVQNLTPAS